MTAQIPDILVHRGRELRLCANPLEEYFERESKRRPPFHAWCTACWRGYVAKWEVRGDNLYLVGLEGELKRGRKLVELVPVDLAAVMPDQVPPILATWVHGWLRCPEGRQLAYVHMGYQSRYERDRMFRVDGGRIVEEWLCLNPPEPVWYLLAGDGTRQRFADPHETKEALDDPFPPDMMPLGHVFFGRPLPDEPEESQGYKVGGYMTLGPPRDEDDGNAPDLPA